MGTLIVNQYLSKERFFLDDYPGASMAYSLRQLSPSTTNVVRVRRSNDNAEANFTATEITNNTLVNWVGAGNDGYVTTLFNQAGSSNDAIQTNYLNQPLIVHNTSGLFLENGRPAIYFNGNSSYLNFYGSGTLIDNFGASANSTALVVSRDYGITGVRSRTVFIGAGTSTRFTFIHEPSLFDFTFNGYNSRVGVSFNIQQQFLAFAYKNGTEQSAYLNSTAFGSNNNGGVFSDATVAEISNGTNLQYLNGIIQEIILYPSSQSTNRTAIEANINSYYNIF